MSEWLSLMALKPIEMEADDVLEAAFFTNTTIRPHQ